MQLKTLKNIQEEELGARSFIDATLPSIIFHPTFQSLQVRNSNPLFLIFL